MKISFACPKCGRQLTADASLAGRAGRCRTCQHRLVVPRGRDAAGSSRTTGGRGTSGKGASEAEAGPLLDWRTAVASQLVTSTKRTASRAGRAAGAGADRVAAKTSPAIASGYSLRPVTPDAVPALSVPDEAAGDFEAVLAPPPDDDFTPTLPPIARAATPYAQPSHVLMAYRWFFGQLVGVSTWISETSYTLSFIVIILAVASGMVGRHSLAQWGTFAVVVLNLVGLAGDLASLVTLSFRRGPVQGALFLVPPFTLYYLWSDWGRYRDAVGRMRIPLATLAVVVAAYLFVPWLRGGIEGEGAIADAVERTIGTVEENFGRPQGAIDEGLKRARSWLREMHVPDPSSLPHLPGSGQHAPGPRR